MKLSLRWKMLYLILLLIIIPIVSQGVNNYTTSVAHLADNVRSTARHSLEGAQDVADVFLKSVEEAALMLTKNGSVQKSALSSQQVEVTLELFAAYHGSHADALNVYLGTRTRTFSSILQLICRRISIPQHALGIPIRLRLGGFFGQSPMLTPVQDSSSFL